MQPNPNPPLNISPVLQPLFLPEPAFAQRFIKVSRVEDPYVRIFDICEDLQSSSRAAVKDYSTCTTQQMGDVLMNLQSYRGLQEIQGISKLLAFCYNQPKREIIAAFQYNDSTLEQIVLQHFFQDNRNQFYLFLLKDLLFVFRNAKSMGIELEDLIPSNILLYHVDNYFRIKILYDEREKKYDKILEGIKVFCSVEGIEAALGISQHQRYQQSKEFIFELGLLLLDVIYDYESKSRKNQPKQTGRFSDLSYKGYHVFEDHSRVKLNAYLIIQKKNFLLSLGEPFINNIVDLISLMISPSSERITFDQLLQKSDKLTLNECSNQPQSHHTPQKHQTTPIKQGYSPDSLKYSQQASNQHIAKHLGTETTLTLTRNVFIDTDYHLQDKNTNSKYNLIPRGKILSEINVHKDIKEQLLKFITVLQSKSSVVKKQYLDGSIYYGQLNTISHKRQGLGMYFYTHGDVYFGDWKDNTLIDGIYIFRNGQCFEGAVKNGKQGWGRYYYLNGNIYQGDWKDDLKEGRGKMTYQNGDIYEGMWVKGKKNGEGTYHYHNGSVYKGNFSNGKKQGFGCITFSNSTKVQAFWRDNHIEGRGKVFYCNGHYYQGDFQFSQKQGQGIYRWEDDTKYIGQFKQDVMLGQAKIQFLDNQYYQGKVTNGKRQGYGVYRYPNGDQFRGEWKNDQKLVGQYRYSDGRIFDGRFKKNEMSYGVMIYENGDKYQGQFSNAERQGLGTYSNSKGEVLFSGRWKRDKLVEKM